MLTNSFICEVEFVGGPIDGHFESLTLPLHTYVGVKVLFHSEYGTSPIPITRSSPGTNPAVTRIAIYQLDNSRNRVSYRFLRTQLLSDHTRVNDDALNSLVDDNHRRS